MFHNLYWKRKLKMIHFKKNLRSIALSFLCLHTYPTKSQNDNFVIHNAKTIFLAITHYLEQVKHHIVDHYRKQYKAQPASLPTKEIPCIEERIDIFLHFLECGQLIPLLRSPDLAVAEKAFCALKKHWPWPRDYTFLIPNLDGNNEEIYFTEKLGSVIKMVEMFHITRKDYIAKYTDTKSFKRIQEYREHCIELQKEGDLANLWKEIIKLRDRITKNGRKTIIADNICLAIVETIYRDPVTKLLHKIKYAPTLEEADDALQAAERYLLEQGKEKNNELMEYKCPCCGSQDLQSARSNFNICSVCYWEDGNIQWQNPDYIRNANDISLNKN